MTAIVPRRHTADDIDHIRDLVRAGVVGTWHYRWPELEAVAARLGVTPDNAIWRTQEGTWPAPTAADHIREANAR